MVERQITRSESLHDDIRDVDDDGDALKLAHTDSNWSAQSLLIEQYWQQQDSRTPFSICIFFSSPYIIYPPRTIPSKRFLNHFTVSAWLILCEAPILLVARRLLATRAPGRVLCSQ